MTPTTIEVPFEGGAPFKRAILVMGLLALALASANEGAQQALGVEPRSLGAIAASTVAFLILWLSTSRMFFRAWSPAYSQRDPMPISARNLRGRHLRRILQTIGLCVAGSIGAVVSGVAIKLAMPTHAAFGVAFAGAVFMTTCCAAFMALRARLDGAR